VTACCTKARAKKIGQDHDTNCSGIVCTAFLAEADILSGVRADYSLSARRKFEFERPSARVIDLQSSEPAPLNAFIVVVETCGMHGL
jgi:hypothetical protein